MTETITINQYDSYQQIIELQRFLFQKDICNPSPSVPRRSMMCFLGDVSLCGSTRHRQSSQRGTHCMQQHFIYILGIWFARTKYRRIEYDHEHSLKAVLQAICVHVLIDCLDECVILIKILQTQRSVMLISHLLTQTQVQHLFAVQGISSSSALNPA